MGHDRDVNRDHQWRDFDSAAYVAANYRSLRQADRWIAEALLETWAKIADRIGDGLRPSSSFSPAVESHDEEPGWRRGPRLCKLWRMSVDGTSPGSRDTANALPVGGAHADAQLIEPSQELLHIWRRWMLFSNHSGAGSDPSPTAWVTPRPEGWPESARWNHERNSVMDGELLECIFLPAYSTPRLMLRDLKNVTREVREVLYPGQPAEGSTPDWVAIRLIFARLHDFLVTHREGGAPSFGPGSYVRPSDCRTDPAAHPFPGIVDSFSISISLCVQAKMLLRWWEEAQGENPGWIEDRVNEQIDPDAPDFIRFRRQVEPFDDTAMEDLLDERLTVAMRQLRDSFIAVPVPEDRWREGNYPYPTGRDGTALAEIKQRLQTRAQALRVSHSIRFHCGFSWGRVAAQDDDAGWYAEPLPYLYFTVGALDAIADVTAQAVRAANILNEPQNVLAAELGFMYEQTSRFWTVLSRLPGATPGTLKIEEVPWRGFDKSTSLYWTLYVLRVITARTDSEEFRDPEYIDRLVRVVEELGQRARISRDPVARSKPPKEEVVRFLARRWVRDGKASADGHDQLLEQLHHLLDNPEAFAEQLDQLRSTVLFQTGLDMTDPALDVHLEGETLKLLADSNRLSSDAWAADFNVYDLAPQLLKVTAKLMAVTREQRTWKRLTIIRDHLWRHLLRRRFASEWPESAGQAWDQVERLREDLPQPEITAVPSWYITERVVEALAAVDAADRARPVAVSELADTVQRVLDDLRWQATVGVPTASRRASFRMRIGQIESRMRDSPAIALVEAMDLARDVDAERVNSGGGP
jgi:hypothetical protein